MTNSKSVDNYGFMTAKPFVMNVCIERTDLSEKAGGEYSKVNDHH